MPISGGYSIPLRTAASANTDLQVVFESLLAAKGTAYSPGVLPTDSLAAAEMFGYAKAIVDCYYNIERMANQWDPNAMGPFIPRWEAILGIVPSPRASIAQRQRAIAARFQLWTQHPTPQTVTDILGSIMGDILVDVEYFSSEDNLATIPGGANVPGGTDIGDGPFFSYISQIIVHVWQPRDHDGNKLISDQSFYDTLNSAAEFLQGFLPASSDFILFERPLIVSGLIIASTNSTSLVGVGTSFLTEFFVGAKFSSIDDDGNYQQYEVASIADDSHLTLAVASPSDNTAGIILYEGFFLDQENNLDSEAFSILDILTP